MKAALLYAQRLGWRVLPVHSVADGRCSCGENHLKASGLPDGSAGKHPRLKDWVKEASNDPATVEQWIKQWPASNIGIATGSGSGFFVLDVDPEHGGAESLAQLEAEHGALPKTVQAVTGSGGSHYLFTMPDFGVTNSAGKVGKGLDIRGDGGQIVVAPSRSAKGTYRWISPPWATQVAAAPEWLISELGRVPTPKPGVASTGRGHFPAASPAVIEQAREALEFHGPAIDGDGGGLHTVQGAAILTHDFALTDEEAWPLITEWNATCVPPWELDGLRVMLGRGRKYGKAEYGCKRSLDASEAAKKEIADWQARGGSESEMFEVIARVRKLAAISGDLARHSVIETDLSAATGIKPRALDLPKPQRPSVEPKVGEIQVTTRLHEVADESIKALAPAVFARNGVLCQVVKAERTFISDLEPAGIQDLMSRAAKFVRSDETAGLVATAAPGPIASILHARRLHPGIRVLEAITTAPVFLADGSILQDRGYNAQARVYLEPNVSVDVPDEPDRDDARAAVAVFKDLLCDFRFSEEADFSSWLAGLLSPLVKAATGNAPSPLICVSASSPGAGKSLLTEVIARVVTGSAAEISPYNSRDVGEWGKRLTAFVKAASPVRVFDNVNGAIGDEGIDRLITSPVWSDRILGASEAPPLPNVTTWFATGNNIEPIGDTVRRVLVVRIEVDTERPQERTGFKRPLLNDHAEKHRSELLTAALTILRAYHVAGRPDQKLASWGSFVAWSTLVRGALVWSGLADPFGTQQRAASDLNEPENDAHDFWIGVVEASDGFAASVVTTANQRDAQGVLGAREPISATHLRRFIGRFIDKPRDGKRIRRERDHALHQTRYFVEVVAR